MIFDGNDSKYLVYMVWGTAAIHNSIMIFAVCRVLKTEINEIKRHEISETYIIKLKTSMQ